ncbi:hypothetical protein TNCV_1040031 [Trichonephila clavipes]|nr:hypothetical protein TNCV_1040031 [Trichonephila clavipes]
MTPIVLKNHKTQKLAEGIKISGMIRGIRFDHLYSDIPTVMILLRLGVENPYQGRGPGSRPIFSEFKWSKWIPYSLSSNRKSKCSFSTTHHTRNLQGTSSDYCDIPCRLPASTPITTTLQPTNQEAPFSPSRTFKVTRPHSLFSDGTEERFAFNVPI